MFPECPVRINIFEQEPEPDVEVWKPVDPHMEELQKKYQIPMSHMKLQYNRPLPIVKEPAYTENEMEFLQGIELEELVTMAHVDPLYWDEAGEFLFSLKDAFVRMIDAIIERNPQTWNSLPPHSFPEIEIYDSVMGIMDDEELEELNVILGGDPEFIAEVVRANAGILAGLESLVCKQTSWGKRVTAPELFVVYAHGEAQLPYTPWVPFELVAKEVSSRKRPVTFINDIERLYEPENFRVIRLAEKYIE